MLGDDLSPSHDLSNLATRGHTQSREDPSDMGLHRASAQKQTLCDLRIAEPLGHEFGDLPLARTERIETRCPPGSALP